MPSWFAIWTAGSLPGVRSKMRSAVRRAAAGSLPRISALRAKRRPPPRHQHPTQGFAIGTTTVFRYIREALDVLAALAPTLRDAVTVCC